MKRFAPLQGQQARHHRHAAVGDRSGEKKIGYFVEASSDLSAWTSTEVTSLVVSAQPYTHTDTADLSATPRRFLRLKVTLAP